LFQELQKISKDEILDGQEGVLLEGKAQASVQLDFRPLWRKRKSKLVSLLKCDSKISLSHPLLSPGSTSGLHSDAVSSQPIPLNGSKGKGKRVREASSEGDGDDDVKEGEEEVNDDDKQNGTTLFSTSQSQR
jgi:hypothetical protein